MESKKKGIIIFLIFLSVLGILYVYQKKESLNIPESGGYIPESGGLTQKQIDDSVRAMIADTSTVISQVKYIEVKNLRGNTTDVALGYYNNSSWESHGWYSVKPFGDITISLPESFNDDSVYWYAIDNEGNLEWTGKDKTFCINTVDAFDYKGNDSKNCKNGSKGFYKLDLTGETTKITLSIND